MRANSLASALKVAFKPARISRSLSVILAIALLQVTSGVQAPYSYAAAGVVGPATGNGSCQTSVGGTESVTGTFVNDTFCLLKFTSGTTWTVPIGVNTIDILVVGGGGGAGSDGGGGGGGGEVRTASAIAVTANLVITTTVGAGGIGGSWKFNRVPTAGGTSSIVINGTTYSAGGGGTGVGWQSTLTNAARGSGGSGGTAVTGGTNYSMGGTNSWGTPSQGGVGFDGVSTTFTGTSTYFAGGGGGGQCTNNVGDATFGGMAGGLGGGGRGSLHTQNVGSDTGTAGTDYLGGGGGAGSACNDGGTDGTNARMDGGRGGSGVVYIKYIPIPIITTHPESKTAAVGSTATFSATNKGTITGATHSVRWQVKVSGGSWTDIPGATSDTYTTPAVTRSMDANQYAYLVTDAAGGISSTRQSASATLTVVSPYQSDTDTALTFNGSNQYAEVSDTTGSPFDLTGTITLEAWVKPATTCSSDQGVVAKYLSFSITCGSGVWKYGFSFDGISMTLNATTIPVVSGEWRHLAVTRSGSPNELKFYLDGQLALSTTATSAMSANNQVFQIGRYGTANHFQGQIDEVRVFNSVRDSASVLSDMNTYGPISNANLVAYYDFNEGSPSSTLYNRKAGATAATDLSISNSPLWTDIKTLDTSSATYTYLNFPRTYITVNGGWRVPSGVSQISSVVVAGGGGGNGETDGSGWMSGGGGAGGYLFFTTTVTAGSVNTLIIGQGGRQGKAVSVQDSITQEPLNGQNSTFLGRTAIGGGYGGGRHFQNTAAEPAGVGGSGGGGGTYGTAGALGTSGQGNSGGAAGAACCAAGGGGGAGSAGGDGDTTSSPNKGGAAGDGVLNPMYITNLNPQYLAAGGAGGSLYGSNGSAGTKGGVAFNTSASANTGSGGGGGGGGNSVYKDGGYGGSGIVIVRWITASVPTYSKPTNAYLNVGMTETFTTNVAQDSATVTLTRTFKWESTTPSAGGVYTLIKQGTGAANASFSWIPTDTSTSGSGFLYRLTVTDSDTAGLFITDSSTAYAVINRALVVSGASTIPKAINLAKSETFTISLGTSTYRSSLAPVIPGITLDTSTAGYPVIKIADTMTVGTYYETLTVIDSVSATVVTPLTIKIQAPPALANTGEIVNSGLVFNLDFSNSVSYNPITSVAKDISGSNRSLTTNGSPTYSTDFSGVMSFKSTGTSQYMKYTNSTQLKKFTLEAYVRIDAEPGAQKYIIASQYTIPSDKFNYSIVLDAGRTIWAGYYATGYIGYRTSKVLDLNKWYHVVATWDRLTTVIYIDGAQDTGGVATTVSSATDAPLGGSEVYINRKWDADAATDMSLGFVRIYDRDLSIAEITQNYNATKTRFAAINQTQLTPSKKYGVLNLESFTVTAGSDTKTVSLAVGDRFGIDWDTTTVTNQVKISIQESLTVGTYYDTITVTDNLGQATYLPITFTVSKADTITVSMSAGLTTVYTGSQPTNAPKATITGLVGFDSATVSTQYTDSANVGSTCALGGICKIGDRGPGGGYVFYIGSTVINAATGISAGGKYLEIAPANWNGNNDGTTRPKWSTLGTVVSGTVATFGQGAENTRLMVASITAADDAAKLAANSTSGNQSDWFVPTTLEMQTAYDNLTAIGSGDFTSSNYWTSVQDPSNSANAFNFWAGANPNYSSYVKTQTFSLRPIRAFSPVSDTFTVVPTDVETYTAKGVALTFNSGLVTNYAGVVYETSTLKITQAFQNKLNINLYGAIAGSPFTILVSGGSGTGAVSETITASGSTASNCRFSSYHELRNDNSASDQKMCRITITKAQSRNYFSESLTADVYFMVFVNNEPTNQMGSGATIALNGETSFSTNQTLPPSVTLLSSTSISATSGGTFTVTGTGFNLGGLRVKFNRNKFVTPTSFDATSITFNVSDITGVGATTGRIVVMTNNGEAVSRDTLVINP